MRKSLVPVALLIITLMSCENFAQKHGLTESPAGDLAMEILDQSTITQDGSAVLHASFSTTQPEWGNFLYMRVEFSKPSGTTNITLDSDDIRILEDDNYRITVTSTSNYISQGLYSLKLFAGDNDLEETYRYPMELSVDDSGSSLYVRETEDYEPRTPYIMEGVTNYDIAVSGTDSVENIHIRANNAFSASVYAAFNFKNNSGYQYLLVVAPNDMTANEWTTVSAEQYLIPLVENTTALPLDMCNDTDWEVISYASAYSLTSWGELIRSEIRMVNKSDDAPEPDAAAASMGSRTMSSQIQTLDTVKLSPLFRQMLEDGSFGK